MKNLLKIKPEDWAKEREIRQFSFFLQSAVIFTLIAIPFCLLINFLLNFINEDWKIDSIIVTSIIGGTSLAFSQWSGLESNYRKSVKNRKGREV
jgi:hypothetical protein